MLDILALSGLEWLYERVEDRYGRGAAWAITLTVGLSVIAILVWILIAVFAR